MAIMILWNSAETILLVDVYYVIENGIRSRKLAVKLG